jgi:hypothetical protein
MFSVFPPTKILTLAALSILTFATLTDAPSSRASTLYSQGFEADNAGWDVWGGTNDATRVISGTNGVNSKSGNFHAQATTGNSEVDGNGSAATNWGGYRSSFGGGFTSSIDIYLDVGAISSNDTRFDWDMAVNDSSGNFRRDFVFNVGGYNDATSNYFVISASNNAGRGSSYPKNPDHGPVTVAATGWYTFQNTFYDNGGVLADDMKLLDASGTALGAWTRSDPNDLIATQGGNRYGWFDLQEFPFLAIDNALLVSADAPAAAPLPLTAYAGLALLGGLALYRARFGGRKVLAAD